MSAPGLSPILFSENCLDPVSASFLNATYAGSMDADDVHVGAMLHPGCIVFSAALAIGQSGGKSGAQVLAAAAAGYEAMIRIALAIQPTHFKRGFQSTSTCGVFGSSVAASKLLFTGENSADRIAEAIGIGASFAGGLTQFYHSGSTVKRIHAAQAASSGVKSSLLVHAGFSGPMDILEGKDGFARAYADEVDFSELLDGLGESYRISEVAVKPHACSARVLSAIEATTQICKSNQIEMEHIESIHLGIPKVILGRLTTNTPADLQAAQMSAPFCVALAIVHQKEPQGFSLSVGDFEAGLRNSNAMQLAKLVVCQLDEEVEASSSEESVSAKVEIRLKDGSHFSSMIQSPKGSISRPFSREEHIARLKAELQTRYSDSHIDRLLDTIQHFSEMTDVTDLSKLLC
jgi:2-methylcitrate dehydratase PrpD